MSPWGIAKANQDFLNLFILSIYHSGINHDGNEGI
jgi:hypothetical protein